MNAYEEKQEAKRERLEKAARKQRQEAHDRFETAHKMGNAIPFGQPILIGHHSEKRDRNYRDRIHTNMRKGVEASDKADYYEQRAEGVGKGGISSDDPDAIIKLQEKLKRLEASHKLMVDANRAVRLKDIAKGDAKLMALGLSDDTIASLRTVERGCKLGFQPYQLQNSSGNIRRIRERITILEAKQGEVAEQFQYDDIKVVYNVDENRVQIIFPDKPSDEIRTELKYRGFRWSPYNKAWQRQLNNAGKWAAKCTIKFIQGLEK